ncbi:hypothetical protein GmHk_05G013368 [Glycine max]|nr:hypothetical protein GmHk_05G013368 [Glycine max]
MSIIHFYPRGMLKEIWSEAKAKMDYYRIWRARYPCHLEEIWKQYNFLKWPLGSMEWWQNISESVVSLVTEEDLRSSTKNDPDWLVEQRETEIKLIEGWISDYHQKNKAMFDM